MASAAGMEIVEFRVMLESGHVRRLRYFAVVIGIMEFKVMHLDF